MNKNILITILAVLSISAFAQQLRLPVENTLSNPVVNCMAVDDDGYLWIGTRRGLNRFNGSNYMVYYQADSLSLANDFVTSLCKDTDGRMWVGTSTGISLLRNGEVDPSVNVSCGSVFCITTYDEDRLLVLLRNSVYIMDKETFSMTPVWQDDSVVSGHVTVTEDGMVWIYDIRNPLIHVLDSQFSLVDIISLSDSRVCDVHADIDGTVLVATESGMRMFDSSGRPLAFNGELKKITQGQRILFVTSNTSGQRCVGVRGKGIYAFEGEGEGLHRIWEEEDLDGLQQASAIFTEHNIFISKDMDGMDYHHLASDRSVIKVSDNRDETLNMFYDFSDDQLLILTNRNVYVKKIGESSYKKIRIDGQRSRDWMTISHFDRDTNLWILNNGNELRKYRFEGDRLRLLRTIPVESTNSIWGTKESGDVYLLQSNGILQIDEDGTLRRNRMMKYPDFWFCGTTSSGLTYFLDNSGVWYFDEGKAISRLPVDVKSPECLYEDEEGLLWIGSQGSGIYVYDPEDGSIENINVSHGIPDNTTRSIIGDDKGNIWVSSRCEVYKISRETRNITLYGSPENMNFSYNSNSSRYTDGGYVLFGSKTHIAAFSSSDEVPDNNLQVSLDGLVIDSKRVDKMPEEIVLEHDGNVISFYYSAMNYDPGMKLSYRYRLEGHHEDWVYVGSTTRVNFTGLKPGRYTLEVAVQNSTGQWSENALTCGFRVKASPWTSPMAVFFYFILSGFFVLFLMNLTYQLKSNRRKLEQAEHERVLNESLNKEKTDFFTNISHEYRTPLTLIYGPVRELLGSNSLNEHDKYLISLVAKNTERMMGLTDQVLSYYTYDDKETLKVMKSEVSVFLKSMLQSFDYMFRQKELTLNIEIADDIRAYCDREKIERILFNVLSNAAKYTPEGGAVTVKAGVADDNLIVSVADTGVGISPDKMRSIFDRFERGDMEGGNLPGFGIGLNYALHLAVLHKGLLTVAPNLPKGSVFTLSVPSSRKAYDPSEIIMDTEASNENAIIPDEKATGVKDMTILIAEDNIELANYMRHLLLKDYNVILASNGNEVMECIKVSAPDIVISDIMMPFKDGYELCSEIKSNPEFCHLPVILLTAKADMDSQILGMEKGADAYLKKPFEPNLLFAVIKGIIDNRRKSQNILMSSVAEEKTEEVEQVEMSRHDRIFVEKLHAMMEEHLADEEFNVTAMSKEFGMSRTSLFSKIKALYGASPQAWITDYRLNKAMELLKTREYNVSEVSYKVGFSTLTGFSRSFKNKFGFPPSAV